MTALFSDTRPEAEAVLIRLLREALPWHKLEMVDQLNQSIKMLALAGLRRRYPNVGEDHLHRRLADLLPGEELALKVYGPQFTTNPEQKAFMTTAEDIILAKLEWYRLGKEISDRQWRDILEVLKVQAGRLDMEYLRKWAAELNVA